MQNRASSQKQIGPRGLPADLSADSTRDVESRGRAGSVTVSAIVVDDEKLASDELVYQLKTFADVEILATASNGSGSF